jgi:hypothetical protein
MSGFYGIDNNREVIRVHVKVSTKCSITRITPVLQDKFRKDTDRSVKLSQIYKLRHLPHKIE